MIRKHFKNLVIMNMLVAVIIGALFIYSRQRDDNVESVAYVLVDREFLDVREIQVDNELGGFKVKLEGGGFYIEDLSSDIIDVDHLKQIIAHSAYVSYDQQIDSISDLTLYGFDKPAAHVVIEFVDNQQLELIIGNEGPLQNTYYVYEPLNDKVYLFKKANVVRYLYEKKNFINRILVPPHASADVMASIDYVKYSGKRVPRDIIIMKLDDQDDKQMLAASSFGAASHLMIQPTLQKVDLREAQYQFLGIVGLLSKAVVDYDISDTERQMYGFDQPDYAIEFVFREDGINDPIPYLLEVVYFDGEPYVMVNKNGVVHVIEDEAFLHLHYEKLISRWFFTPLLLDVQQLHIKTKGNQYLFNIERLGENQIRVLLDNQSINSDAFRKFYNLVVSASHDGSYAPFTVNKSALLEIEFVYHDDIKGNDVITYYPGETRRHNVCFNGTCEFVINDRFVSVLEQALVNLIAGEDFTVSWE